MRNKDVTSNFDNFYMQDHVCEPKRVIMRKQICFGLSLLLILILLSCKKENAGISISTVIKGHVADTIRKINISGYKIVLVKSTPFCANWMCGTKSEEVATAYTDKNGDYSIKFNYKLNPGETYNLAEQYYGNPYYPEYYSGSGAIVAGTTNTKDIYVWKPINLRLNVDVSNNKFPSLNIRNNLVNSNEPLFNVEFVYEQNIKKTLAFSSKPNSDINIIFWYYTGDNSSILHQKTIPFRTTLEDTTTLNYSIDCSTF